MFVIIHFFFFDFINLILQVYCFYDSCMIFKILFSFNFSDDVGKLLGEGTFGKVFKGVDHTV